MFDMKLFWNKVNKTDSCWIWKAGTNNKGYGVFCIKRKTNLAHRISWKIHYDDPGNSNVLHKCDNPLCVNPSHLFLGSQAENVKDCIEKNRFQHGEKNGRCKLTQKEVDEIRKLLNDGVKNVKLAKMFNISQTCISNIKQGISWVK